MMASAATYEKNINLEVKIGQAGLPGILTIPEFAKGIVIFSHSCRNLSKRNQKVASQLVKNNIGSLMFDLLTPEEEQERHNVFDIDFLADRLDDAKHWLRDNFDLTGLPFGYFASSTGAAAALLSAAKHPNNIHAVVSRGGRPDLAGNAIAKVVTPTLLMVGNMDDYVIELNQKALDHLSCQKSLKIIPGSSHLFGGKESLDSVSRMACSWFLKYF